jgi:hypothetical protein
MTRRIWRSTAKSYYSKTRSRGRKLSSLIDPAQNKGLFNRSPTVWIWNMNDPRSHALLGSADLSFLALQWFIVPKALIASTSISRKILIDSPKASSTYQRPHMPTTPRANRPCKIFSLIQRLTWLGICQASGFVGDDSMRSLLLDFESERHACTNDCNSNVFDLADGLGGAAL